MVRWRWLGKSAVILVAITVTWWAVRESAPPTGPIMTAYERANTVSTQTTYAAVVGDKVAFGGWPVENLTHSPFVITGKSVANAPAGVRVQAGPAYQVVGVSKWVATEALPFVIAAGVKDASVIVNVEPTRRGRFIIQGLLINYAWQHKRFAAYIPDQFTLGVASSRRRAFQECDKPIPSHPDAGPPAML